MINNIAQNLYSACKDSASCFQFIQNMGFNKNKEDENNQQKGYQLQANQQDIEDSTNHQTLSNSIQDNSENNSNGNNNSNNCVFEQLNDEYDNENNSQEEEDGGGNQFDDWGDSLNNSNKNQNQNPSKKNNQNNPITGQFNEEKLFSKNKQQQPEIDDEDLFGDNPAFSNQNQNQNNSKNKQTQQKQQQIQQQNNFDLQNENEEDEEADQNNDWFGEEDAEIQL